LSPLLVSVCAPLFGMLVNNTNLSLTRKTGGFWLATAISLTPSANATGAFTTGAESTVGVEYYTSYGEFLGWLVPDTLREISHTYFVFFFFFFHAAFFFVCMASLSFVFLICGIRTNLMFEVVFLTLTLGFSCLAASYWQLANDLPSASAKLQTVRLQYSLPL
jgi:hypothetical protein